MNRSRQTLNDFGQPLDGLYRRHVELDERLIESRQPFMKPNKFLADVVPWLTEVRQRLRELCEPQAEVRQRLIEPN